MRLALVTLSALSAITLAEAIPAPRNQDAAPRYYYPREIKRQVLNLNVDVNSTGSTQTTASGNLVNEISDFLTPSNTATGLSVSPSSAAPSASSANSNGVTIGLSSTVDKPTSEAVVTPSQQPTAASVSSNQPTDAVDKLTTAVGTPSASLSISATDAINSLTPTANPTSGLSISESQPASSAAPTSVVVPSSETAGVTGPNTAPTSSEGLTIPSATPAASTDLVPTSVIPSSVIPSSVEPTVTPPAITSQDPTSLPASTDKPSETPGVSFSSSNGNTAPTQTPTDTVVTPPPETPTVPPSTSAAINTTPGSSDPVTGPPTSTPTDGPSSTVGPEPPTTTGSGPTSAGPSETPGVSTSKGIDSQTTGPTIGPSTTKGSDPETTGPTSAGPSSSGPSGSATDSSILPTGARSSGSSVTESVPESSATPFLSTAPSTLSSGSSTETAPPQSIKPTATNTLTALSQESVITSASSTKEPASSASTIPTSLPRIIQPQGGVAPAPENGTLIQLGFTYGLNYPFVVSNSWAVQQIFDYLPPGVSYGITVPKSEIIMQYLQPYNTLSRNGYITTLAMAFIPDDQVNPLSLALLNPKSSLYNNPDATVKTLMAMLDPSIPLLAGQTVGDGSPINSANSASTSHNGNSDSAAGGDGTSGDSAVKPSSVGIGLGVVGGAAVYGIAMFMVAKRYKKRKNAHQRASSVQSGSTASSGPGEGSTLMRGARNSYGSRPQQAQSVYPTGGRESRTSDRSQQSGRTYISPPVMAENSLGWN